MKKLSLLVFLLFSFVATTIAQRTVTGTVTDVNGEPLIGASVLAAGSSVGTITDIDGSFSISVPEGTSQIEISYTGYDDQLVDISSSSTVAVQLAEGKLLDEIVVTASGLEKNKARLGYAIQNVNADELVQSKEVNIVDALNGKATGVQVTSSSGAPGASSNIIIRGATSINGTNSPLFVIDGIPMDNSEFGNGVDGVDQSNRAIDINPNDVANMTILKGPAATALYGVRAANGAIVITTKKGQAGAPKVSINAGYTLNQVNKLPERQSIYSQGRNGAYRDPSTGEGFSWGPLLSTLEFDSEQPSDFDRNGSLVPVGEGTGEPAVAYDPYSFFVNGHSYDLNASVSGGTENFNYFISAGNNTSNGYAPNAEFKRNSFRVNLGSQINDNFDVGMNLAFIQSGGYRLQRGSNIQGVMLGLLRNTPTFDIGNGLEGREASEDPSSYIRASDEGQRSYRAGIYDNPYWVANKNPSRDDVSRVIGSIFANYKLTNQLSLGTRVGMDNYADRRNGAIDINPGRSPGSVAQEVYTNRDVNVDIFANYSTDLTDDLTLSSVVGWNFYDHRYIAQGTYGTGLAAPNFYHISNASDLTAAEAYATKRLAGAYGTFDFGYKNFAFLNLTARNDWTSILPKEANTFNSYSAALGLVVTEMLGLQSNFLDYAKVRASYGKVGNDGGDVFVYSTSNYFDPGEADGDGFITEVEFPAFGGNAFERSPTLGNEVLRPESTTVLELGTELKFFNGRLGTDINYFSSRSSDQIIAVDLSATTGFTSAIQNTGDITSKGWEISLTGTPVRTRDFEWNVDVNFTAIETTVESLTEGIENVGLAGFTSTSAVAQVGAPFSAIFGDGFRRTDDGQVIVGADGWPLSNPTKTILGDPNPDFTVGFNNTFTYKGITVGALLDLRKGGDVWCGTCGIMDYFGTSARSADEREDVVVFNGVVNTGTEDEPVYVENTTAVALANEADVNQSYRVRYGFGGISEMSIYDSSWLRLRTVSLGFDLPQSWIDNTSLGNVNVALAGRNLWLSTEYPGIDPETNLTGASNGYGLDYFNNPNAKSYSATVNITF